MADYRMGDWAKLRTGLQFPALTAKVFRGSLKEVEYLPLIWANGHFNCRSTSVHAGDWSVWKQRCNETFDRP
jgi:hypothetical protein